MQRYSVMYEHLRAQALNVEQTRQFIADIAKEYAQLTPQLNGMRRERRR